MTIATNSRLLARIVPVDALDRVDRQMMYRLLASHFVGPDRATFEADLAEKSCTILLEDDTGVLRGFSTLLVYRTCVAGCPMSVVYSGDTIVERSWWGSSTLPRAWIRAVRTLAPANGTPSLLVPFDVRLSHVSIPTGLFSIVFPEARRPFTGRCRSTPRDRAQQVRHSL